MPTAIPWPACTMCHAAPAHGAQRRCHGCTELLDLQVRLGEAEHAFQQRVTAYKLSKRLQRLDRQEPS